ncbi:hypothetical protein Tco_0433414 [Tanacetum coccineum]
MVSFQRLHSHLKLLSNNDLKGTRTESGFKREFATLFGQDPETFTGTMFLNMDQLEKQLDKEEFQEIGSMAAFKVLETQFQKFIKSRTTSVSVSIIPHHHAQMCRSLLSVLDQLQERYDESYDVMCLIEALDLRAAYSGSCRDESGVVEEKRRGTCLMPLALKTQNDSLAFVHELKKEMHADLKYVESLENEIDKLEYDKAEFSNMYDMLLQECVSNDVMCSYLHSFI